MFDRRVDSSRRFLKNESLLIPLSIAILICSSACNEVPTLAPEPEPELSIQRPASEPESDRAPQELPGTPPDESTGEAPQEDAIASDSDEFLGEPDRARREALMQQPIAQVERGRGGRSLAFKITLADGTVGYFKPEQSFSGAHWYAELAAYYLDRALGLGRTSPSIGRTFAWAPLREAAGADARVREVRVSDEGTVRGAFIWWIPERLVRLPTGAGWEKWIRLTGGIDLSPFQRPSEYREAIRRRREGQTPERVTSLSEPDLPSRPAELSDMILFDYLTSNVDRWGGENTNIRTRAPGGPLIYLDNGAGFWPNAQVSLMETRLRMVQRFRRETIAAIRAFNMSAFRERLNSDPLAPILSENLLEGIAERLERVVAHVEAMQERFGERIWFDEPSPEL